MASLKDLRDRIASVKATQKITRAMQMVAAAKLRRAQEAVEAARPYAERMSAAIKNVGSQVVADEAPLMFTGTGKDKVHLVVVCSAERGLCGGFNSHIARHARDHIRDLLKADKEVKIFTVGRKASEILRREFGSYMIEHMSLQNVKTVSFAQALSLSQKIISLFKQGQFDVCTLFYSHFKSVICQEPCALQLVPAAADFSFKDHEEQKGQPKSSVLYAYEPDAASLLESLVTRNLTTQIFRALLENAAGEMGAKMTAMDNATRNAGDMINRLSITYNRQRQAQITTELIEIIAGAEAL